MTVTGTAVHSQLSQPRCILIINNPLFGESPFTIHSLTLARSCWWPRKTECYPGHIPRTAEVHCPVSCMFCCSWKRFHNYCSYAWSWSWSGCIYWDQGSLLDLVQLEFQEQTQPGPKEHTSSGQPGMQYDNCHQCINEELLLFLLWPKTLPTTHQLMTYWFQIFHEIWVPLLNLKVFRD